MTPKEIEAKLTLLDKKTNIALNVLNTLMRAMEKLRVDMINAEQSVTDEADRD